MAAANVLAAREAAVKATLAKENADLAAREAAAVALRLFDNDAELVSGLLGVPAEELEREAKPVTAARAKEVIETLRSRAERPRTRRNRSARPNATSPSPSAPAQALVGTPDDGPADGL
jgi:hypothetical protein